MSFRRDDNRRSQNMQPTSLEAYRYIKHKAIPTIGDRQQLVLDVIRASKVPLTDLEIANKLRFGDPNHVRPRRYELVEMGVIEKAGKRPCTISGRKAFTWRITPRSTYRVTEENELYSRFSEGF